MRQSGVDQERRPPGAVSIGMVVGGTTPENTPWVEAVKALGRRIIEIRGSDEVPLNLNIVFHVGGKYLNPEFAGVRTGRYFRMESVLVVQVAIDGPVPDDPTVHLKAMAGKALDAAEQWASRRKVPANIPALRDIVDAV